MDVLQRIEQALEAALTLEPLFDQAMVVGEGRPYLTAALVLADTPWRRLAARGWPPELCKPHSETPTH